MKKIGVDTKLTAIIGTDIGHSKSPAMMNAAFEAKQLNYYFFPMNIQPQNFGKVIQGISGMNFAGLTITIPYKLEILKYLDEIDPLAKVIGAVNTVRISDDRLTGYNTDGEGFVRGLETDCGIHVPDHTFFVAGSGGVSRAITTVLASRRPQKIYLANRTPDKAVQVAEAINREVFPCCEALALDKDAEAALGRSTVLINATNVGMSPLLGQTPLPAEWLHQALLVADVIYNPLKTKLMEEAEKIGCRTIGGQSLLLHQGKIAFSLWTGEEAPGETMAQAVFAPPAL